MKCFHTDPRFASSLDLGRQHAVSEVTPTVAQQSEPEQTPPENSKQMAHAKVKSDLELRPATAKTE